MSDEVGPTVADNITISTWKETTIQPMMAFPCRITVGGVEITVHHNGKIEGSYLHLFKFQAALANAEQLDGPTQVFLAFLAVAVRWELSERRRKK